MNFKDIVNFRQSIRIFNDKKVSEEDIKDIVKTAQRAPSWVNAQPWKVYVAMGDTLKQIKENHLDFSRLGVRGNADWDFPANNSWDNNAIQNMMDWSNGLRNHLGADADQMAYSQSHLFDAQALVYLTLPKTASNWSIYDLGAFGQTLMLAAADKKIDTMPAYEIVKYPDSLREILGVSEDRIFAMGIALGYRDDSKKINSFRTRRLDEDKMLEIKK